MSVTNEKQFPQQPEEFHLGLTMAGAASAGCYTAGAMDYLFEILDLWEKAKGPAGTLPEGWDKSILEHVPQHKVIIDAMGGTSAGGMTTVMSAIYALNGIVNPVKDPADPTQKKNNVMYDSWVLMGDEAGKPKIFETTFNTTDLDETGKIQSLLNSDFIDKICDEAFIKPAAQQPIFPYVAKDLELILSHTMLRSIPLAVDFTTPTAQLKRTKKSPEHSTFEHFAVSRFKLDYDEGRDKDKYLPLDPFNKGRAALKLATMATGAFPVGLKFREFFAGELSVAYLKSSTENIAFNRLSDIPAADVPAIEWPDNFPDPYHFVSVDGGAINNEPFGEVLAILKNKYGKKRDGEDYKYAMIMIDPFPDVPSSAAYRQPDDLFSVVPAIIGTLWDQSKVKRAEMLDAYSSDYYRGEIFPVRWKKKNSDEQHPIACGAAMAFSGLMDISFRHHDFFLGRDNARNFFRTFFTLEYNKAKGIVHPVHKDWSDEMVALFKRPGVDGSVFLPIVPDLHILKERSDTGKERNPLERTVATWPQYDAANLFALQPKIEARVKKMLTLTMEKMTAEKRKAPMASGAAAKPDLAAEWMNRQYKSNWWKKFTGWLGSGVLKLLFKWNKGKIAAKVAKAAIEWFLKDLDANGLLKKSNH
ncbi:MAG: hypothetical protein DI535_05900 [Citrobacter freundii]|nr:MAG: hypothetical protein DI535_05900 [Citrobacter freundii]